ncbi:arsenic transporter [Streptomyces dangxiongensis]|uniref:Arsenic transporter n=1 Tax=Streptomyces dangxiongensis TaxID=1442032 RepID=A0A3G2J8R6_9ACTN|nr:SLC13 family permease [Streptomyces dangxiongensis]AYN38071.1 arsenic transporter [Streptomyces dangxiongensis]
MNTVLAEALSVVLLVAVLAWAVVRPFGRTEAVMAVPAAGIAIATGAISLDHARAEAERLGPVVGFLAAVLVLAHFCDVEGLFQACGAWTARWAAGRPVRLLTAVFALASAITAVLSLDATVVLLTPVVFATAARTGVRPKPHVYACTHLSNTASLLLPVSNLTNLLAFAASGLAFTRFAALMALPWLAAIGVEYLVFRRFFARDLAAAAPAGRDCGEAPVLPLFALVTVGGTLAGFVVASAFGVEPAWVAGAGALVLAGRSLLRRRATVPDVVRAAAPSFLVFVLALGVVVRAVVDNGLADVLGHVVPDGTGLPALLGTAALAAVLANVINNLPAVLVLLPLAAPAGPGAVLAVLLGVNIGPNLTYAGSLATLLWRRIVHQHEHDVDLGEFTRLGLLAVPSSLAVAVVALWGSLRIF